MGEVAKAKEWLAHSVELFRGMDAGLDAASVQGRLEQIETERPSASGSTAPASSTGSSGSATSGGPHTISWTHPTTMASPYE
jgi:hypothetical protein